MSALRRLALLPLLIAAACYQTRQVRPDQLPSLNGAFTSTAAGTTIFGPNGQHAETSVTTQSVRSLVAPDGRTFEVRGEAAAIVHTRRGDRLTFEHPVIATVEGELLTIHGSNRAPLALRLDEIQRADVRWRDRTATMLWMGGIGLAVVAVSGFLVYHYAISDAMPPE